MLFTWSTERLDFRVFSDKDVKPKALGDFYVCACVCLWSPFTSECSGKHDFPN